jgi:hypothetical protein
MKELNGKCYLYIIQVEDHFKIGISSNPRQRTLLLDSALFTKAILRCVVLFDNRFNAEKEERSIQHELEEFNVKGEWFKLSFEDIIKKISSHGLLVDYDVKKLKIAPLKNGKKRLNVVIYTNDYNIIVEYKESHGCHSLDEAVGMLLKEFKANREELKKLREATK